MKRLYLTAVILIMLLVGCTEDNPKTQNELLRDKKISWSDGHADFYELMADGTFIAVGGDLPQEGYKCGIWESVSEDGSFKIIKDPLQPQNYLIARMKIPIAKGVAFVFESYIEGKNNKDSEKVYTITSYENLKKSHAALAINSDATSYITRYADDVYVLDLNVEDPYGKIQKVLTEGDTITTEGMVTNAKRWMSSPPLILPQGWNSYQRVRSTMTILYHNGDSEKATFLTTGYRDRSDVVFEDAWF